MVGAIALYYWFRNRQLTSPASITGGAFPADAGLQEANSLAFDLAKAQLKILDAEAKVAEGASIRMEQQKAIDAADISAKEQSNPSALLY